MSNWTKEKTITVSVEDFVDKDAIYHTTYVNEDNHTCLVQVLPDTMDASPRDDFNNLWTWVTSMDAGYSDRDPSYNKDNAKYPGSWSSGKWYRVEDFVDDDGHLDKQFLKDNMVVRLYLYRHSGDTIRAGSGWNDGELPQGHARFDSGCMGFAFVSYEELKRAYGKHNYNTVDGKSVYTGVPLKRITKALRDKAMACLHREVKMMNMANSGEVYGFKITDLETEQNDSCWNYYCDSFTDLREQLACFITDYTDTTLEQAESIALRAVELSFWERHYYIDENGKEVKRAEPLSRTETTVNGITYIN